jgi:hypothetical protein
VLLVSAMSTAPFVHGSFFYLAEVLKTVGQVDPSSQATLIALATRITRWLFIAYGVFAGTALIGFAWLTIAITRSKTLYPRWVAFVNRSCVCWQGRSSTAYCRNHSRSHSRVLA